MDAIKRLRELHAKGTQGTWQWFGNATAHDIYLATVERGRVFVMGFKRWGMNGAQPMFQRDHRMVPASELVQYEVPHRADIVGIDHPDASLIAATHNALPALLDAIEAADELDARIADACETGYTGADALHEAMESYRAARGRL